MNGEELSTTWMWYYTEAASIGNCSIHWKDFIFCFVSFSIKRAHDICSNRETCLVKLGTLAEWVLWILGDCSQYMILISKKVGCAYTSFYEGEICVSDRLKFSLVIQHVCFPLSRAYLCLSSQPMHIRRWHNIGSQWEQEPISVQSL